MHKRIADQFRKRPPAAGFAGSHSLGTSTSTATEERVIDPASLDLDEIWEGEWKERIFEAALKRVKTKASIEQYQIFDFYVLKNMPVRKVMSALGVSPTQAYLAKHRVLSLIKREARLLEKQGL